MTALPPYTDRELQARTMLATWIQTRDGRLITRAYETLGGVCTGEGMQPTPYSAPTRVERRGPDACQRCGYRQTECTCIGGYAPPTTLHQRVAAQDSVGGGNGLCGDPSVVQAAFLSYVQADNHCDQTGAPCRAPEQCGCAVEMDVAVTMRGNEGVVG